MYRGHCHSVLLVIVDNLDVRRTQRSVRPLKTDPPLLVDADAVLPLTIAGQGFETISGQGGKVLERLSLFPAGRASGAPCRSMPESALPVSGGEVSGALVPIADDHYYKDILHYALRQA
jgi:hypothetical protein